MSRQVGEPATNGTGFQSELITIYCVSHASSCMAYFFHTTHRSLPHHLHVHAKAVQIQEGGAVHGDTHVVLDHGQRVTHVVLVHVAAHGGREGGHGVRVGGAVLCR